VSTVLLYGCDGPESGGTRGRAVTRPDLSRREFVVLSAATAGSLVTGGTGRAVQATNLTDRYAFLVEYVESGSSIPTLVRFADTGGFDALDSLGVEYRTHTGETVAAHARLTPDQAESIAAETVTERLSYAPGANPFWPLDAYDGRVFPDPADSAGYIAFEEARAGLDTLEGRHPDRLRVTDIGPSHGRENRRTGQTDPRNAWAAELTEGVGTAAATERETVVLSLSIHGDERAGIEAGLRFLEDVLTGDRPGVAATLSDVRVVFVCANPDGWVVRQPVYEDPAQPPDFRRFNGSRTDLNRTNPTAGWIPPDRLAADPRGANLTDDSTGPDEDVPAEIASQVPETLALVDHLRSYDSVEYLLDFHGMYGHSNAVLAIEPGGGTPGDRADTDMLVERVEQRLRDAVGPLDDWQDAFDTAIANTDEQTDCEFEVLCQRPSALFGHGTGFDTIGYTVSGGLDPFATRPESAGGLGATALTLEVVYANSLPDGMAVPFIPDIVSFHVGAYGAACRAAIEHAAAETDVRVETGGRSTAYLDSDELRRQSADLPHVAASDAVAGTMATGSSRFAGGRPDVDSTLAVDSEQFTPGSVSSSVTVPPGTHTLTVELQAGTRPVTATLHDADGTEVARTDPGDGGQFGTGRLTALDPAAGEWRVEASVRDGTTPVAVRTTRLLAQDTPDPTQTLGYSQQPYDVHPRGAIEGLDAVADAPVEPVGVETLRAGDLVVDGGPVYSNLIVSHTHGVDAAALSALSSYVEAGGNLLLTDSGVELAADLDVAGLAAVVGSNIDREELETSVYPVRDETHPLVAGRDTFADDSWVDQREAFTHPPLGYAPGEVSMYSVEAFPLPDDASVVAGESGRARLATLPTETDRVGVHLLGSLLPAATQDNLHPFGLVDHSLTGLGSLLLSNALGYRVVRSRDGEQVSTAGSVVEFDVEVDPGGSDDDGGGDDGGGDGSGGDGSGGDGSGGDDGGGDDGGDGGSGDDGSGGDDGGGDDGGDGGSGDGGPGGDSAADESTDGSGPGFGVAAGVAGLGGLGYLLSQRVTGDDETG
jgi:PGF-CTERM protein